MRMLIVRWSRGRDLIEDLPDVIKWNDGTSGTIDDYIRHMTDTNSLDLDPNGWVMRIYPEIVASIWFDSAAKTWVVGGEGIPTESLGLGDRNASDEKIWAKFFESASMYKAQIVRESL